MNPTQPSEVAMRVAKALQREFGGTFEWTNTLLHMVAGIVDRELTPEQAKCPSCHGNGEWETECCSGAGGCDCRGQAVPMGRCNVCHGSGYVRADGVGVNTMANCDAIRGLCYIGSGPTSGRIH